MARRHLTQLQQRVKTCWNFVNEWNLWKKLWEKKSHTEVNPKTGQTGGMGRSCAQPKSSNGGAYYNNFKRQKTNNTNYQNYQARNGYKISLIEAI
jgi:hypothetical protein